ncbi:MAG TPA: hypothetical protein VE826_14825 [Dongiaceae bacterium]|nr:hypothetical protein [Dongiaceae bacterium]
MKLTRLAALVIVPAAFSLAACSGGSSGVLGNNVGTGGQQANIRFVNGSPDLGSNIDIYLQATGAAAPGAPAAPSTTNMPYGETSLFIAEPIVAYTAIVRAAGSSSGSTALAGLACPIPQLAANAKYTVVISGTNANGHTCRLFQDFDYTTTPQYRVHDAASSLGASIEYGTTNGAAPAAFNAANVATLGSSALASGAAYTQVQPAGPIPNPTSDPVFVIGTTQAGGNIVATDTLDAKSLFASGSLTQPNTAGSLNFPNTAGTSLFAIDCTPASVAALPGVQCNSGAALVGTFDTL